MKKNVLKGAGIGIAIVLLSIIAMYLGLSFYYGDGFSYGTWINGVYCTGKSINEVNDELTRQWNYDGLTITDSDGKSYTILPEDVNLTFDYERTLELYLQKQNPYLWVDNLMKKTDERRLEPEVSYDEAVFNQIVEAMPFFHGKRDEDRVVHIEKG